MFYVIKMSCVTFIKRSIRFLWTSNRHKYYLSTCICWASQVLLLKFLEYHVFNTQVRYTNMYMIGWFVCLFGVYRSTREFFTHKETSLLPVKGCKLSPMLGTYGHWAVRVHLLRHGPTVYNGHLRGPVTLTPNAERLTVELLLPVFTA